MELQVCLFSILCQNVTTNRQNDREITKGTWFENGNNGKRANNGKLKQTTKTCYYSKEYKQQ